MLLGTRALARGKRCLFMLLPLGQVFHGGTLYEVFRAEQQSGGQTCGELQHSGGIGKFENLDSSSRKFASAGLTLAAHLLHHLTIEAPAAAL